MIPTTSSIKNAGIALPTRDASGATTADNSLGKDAFLKLLAAQARSQDPLSPSDNTQQIAQLAQFSSLEQMQNVATKLGTLNDVFNSNSAVQLVGREVTYLDPATGAEATGTVGQVDFGQDGPQLTIGGITGVPVANVQQVR